MRNFKRFVSSASFLSLAAFVLSAQVARADDSRVGEHRRHYSYQDGVTTDALHGFGIFGAAAALDLVVKPGINLATTTMIVNGKVTAKPLQAEEVQRIVAKVASLGSQNANAGVGSLGGATLTVEYYVQEAPKNTKEFKFNLRELPDPKTLETELQNLAAKGNLVKSVTIRSTAGNVGVKVTNLLTVAAVISSIAKIIHAANVSYEHPASGGGTSEADMMVSDRPGILSHFYTDANAKAYSINGPADASAGN